MSNDLVAPPEAADSPVSVEVAPSTDTAPAAAEATAESPAPESTAEAEPAAPPEPTFDDLGLHPDIRTALDDMGYFRPTPVQATVFRPVAEGKDLLVQSRTGTGKTAAFGLPLLNRLVPAETTPQALILAPTRELALQVSRELSSIGKHRGIIVETLYGGAPIGKQINALAKGVHVVVGTPGRVLDHIGRRTLNTRNISTFILDECDEMLSMGFLEDIERVVSHLPEKRQTLLFSATMPDEVTRYSRRHMRAPEQIKLSSGNISVEEIHHAYYVVSGIGRGRDLLKLLFAEEPESAIIFCNMRDETTAVAKFLRKQGLDAEALSSDLSQSDRERVMGRMKAHNLRYLVATDVAARGIDISNLSHVINYSFPESPEVYVHRTGRTGRAGKRGIALSLIGPRDLGAFWMLRLTYKLRPEERDLPPDTIFEGKLKHPLPPLGAPKPPDPVAILVRGVTSTGTDLERAIFEKLLAHAQGRRVLTALVAERLSELTTKTRPKSEREPREPRPEAERDRDRDRERFTRDDGPRDRFRSRDERGPREGGEGRFRDREDRFRSRDGEGGEGRFRSRDGAPEGREGREGRFRSRDGAPREGGEAREGRFRDRDGAPREGGEAREGRFRDRDGAPREGGEAREGRFRDRDGAPREGGEAREGRFRDRDGAPREGGEAREGRSRDRDGAPREGGEGRSRDRDRDRDGAPREGGEAREGRFRSRDGGEGRFRDRDAADRAPREGAEGRDGAERAPSGESREGREGRFRDRDSRDREAAAADRAPREGSEGREASAERAPREGAEGAGAAPAAREDRGHDASGERPRREGRDRDRGRDRHREGRRDREDRDRGEVAVASSDAPAAPAEPQMATVSGDAQGLRADAPSAARPGGEPKAAAKADAAAAPQGGKRAASQEFWETWADQKAARPAPVAAEASAAEAEASGSSSKSGRKGRKDSPSARDAKDKPGAKADKPKREAKAEAKAEEAPAKKARDAKADADGEQIRLFVSLGKKHGITADSLRAFLGGAHKAKIGSVMLRDTHAHVRVPASIADGIIAKHHGTTHDGNDVTIERAR
ncbi:MAG: DEAD/DEAH box helicase [Kofleriaceae bacterium]